VGRPPKRNAAKAALELVHVVERKKADNGVELLTELGGRIHHVGGVERNVEPAAVENAKALQKYRRKVEPLDGIAPLGENQRVSAHSAPDVEHALVLPKTRCANEVIDLPLEIRRSGRNHRPLHDSVVILALVFVVRGDLRRAYVVHSGS